MTAAAYTPRAGSLASQVIGFFRHNPDEELLLDDITDVTQNFASFMTVFEPDLAGKLDRKSVV